MNSLHLARLGVRLARLAAVGLAGACGDTVELDSTGDLPPPNVGPSFDAGPGFDLDAQPLPPYEAVAGDAGAMPDAEVLLGYGQVLVHADPDAASFVASVSAVLTLQPRQAHCRVELIDACAVYTCDAASPELPWAVLPSVRVSGSLGECTLRFDSPTQTDVCQASLWNFDKPNETLTVINESGAFPAFRADLVLPTRATRSAPNNLTPLARTATHFAWSGATAGVVELSLRAKPDCGVTPPEPERYAVCTAPAYSSGLDLPAELFVRLAEVPCLHATLRSSVSTSPPVSGFRLDVRAELDLAGDYTFAEP